MGLQQIRFEEKLKYELSVQDVSHYYLPPLSLQLLLENAVKHTIASAKDPLNIQIILEGEMLYVRNNWRPKKSDRDNMGIGLDNIRKRYQLLGKNQPLVEQNEDFFMVKLPLLKMEE